MRLISLAEAEIFYPSAIARLRDDRSFLKEGEPLVDEYDVFVEGEQGLIFANTLDQLADVWDPVSGRWSEFPLDEDFFEVLARFL
jgi:hypothetical protein